MTMPFGRHGVAATFQWLMNRMLRPHYQYAAICIEDLVICTETGKTTYSMLPRSCGLSRKQDFQQTATYHLRPQEVMYLGCTIG